MAETSRSEWRTALLGDVASITLGGTPSTAVPAFWNGDVPWMASGDVHLRKLTDVVGRITLEGLQQSNATLVDPPAVAVALAGQGRTRGMVALVTSRLCTNQSVALLKGQHGLVDTRFLFHELESRYEELRARSSGGGRAGLSRRVLAAIPVSLPPFDEQKGISFILDTLDELIDLSQKVNTKLEHMRQGLLHDLLTRGIDDNGELRDPERLRAQFVETGLGRSPAEWKSTRLVDVATLPSGQVDPKREPYRSWILVAPDHIESGTGRLLVKHSADLQGAISGKYVVQPGDVLYSKIRPHLRKGTLVDFKGLCSADMYPLRPGDRIRPRILLAVLLGEQFSRFAESVSMRSGFPKINRKELREYSFALPPLSEQDRMDQVLSAQERRLASEVSLLKKLRLLKQGLTRELLGGRVRVTSLLEGDAA